MNFSVKLLSTALVASSLVFSSCGDDKTNDPTPSGTTLTARQDVVLGAQTSSQPSYYGSIDGQRYRGASNPSAPTEPVASDNATKVDITYAALGSDLKPTILGYAARTVALGFTSAPPNNASVTYFKKTTLTSAQFAAINKDNDALFTTNKAGTGDAQLVQPVAVGDVIAYRTTSTPVNLGLINVTAITGGVNGQITFNVKVDKK